VANVEAPHSLRERIEQDRARAAKASPPPFWRRHLRALTAASGAVAAIAVVAVVVGSGSDSPAGPTQAKVQATAQLAPTGSAPASIPDKLPILDVKVGPHAFPDWTKKFGWKATGQRSDELAGREVTTVFYRNPKGAQLGYAVVHGDPLKQAPPGREVRRNGKTYNVATTGGRTVVTWTQWNHTCLLVAPAKVPASKLVDLAASRNA
jgi:hypothetical protein